MQEDIAIDVQNADAAQILRDIAEAKHCEREGYKLMLLKGALEHLSTLEHRNSGLSPHVIAHLRASVLRALTHQ